MLLVLRSLSFVIGISGIFAQSISTCDDDRTPQNKTCVFPFSWDGGNWTQCTYRHRNRPWCSTTSDYDNDGEWGYCDCDNDSYTPAPVFTTPDDEFDHYRFTRANIRDGTLKALVIPLVFEGDDDISVTNWKNYSGASMSQYYLDSSWGKLNFSWTVTPQYYSDIDPTAVTISQMQSEGFRLAEMDGYIYCNGICGWEGRLPLADNHYDHITVVVQYQDGNSNFGWWAGLGSVGYPVSWATPPTSFEPAVMEHEIGHNLGLYHQYDNKYDRMDGIGGGVDGESRMGGGGAVYITSESSRYKSNGHFSPCSKHHFGWLEEQHVITLSPWEEMENNGIFTLNAYDRPDVIPDDPDTINATGSNTFLLKIDYGSQYEYYDERYRNLLYIYYRTSYAGPDAGVSVQYCKLWPSGAPSGGSINTFTYDVKGDTQTKDDHYIDVGQSYVIQPFFKMLDSDGDDYPNPMAAKMYLPNVTVLSMGDGWDDCSDTTYICNTSHPNIAITVQVNWIDPKDAVMANNSETDPFDIIEIELECESDITESLQIDTTDTVYQVIHISADELGPEARGTATINFCAENAHLQAYIYDLYPYNFLNNDRNQDLGIGSLMRYAFNGNLDGYSCVYPECELEAVQVMQDENSHLHLAEIEIFTEINGTNIANESNCYTFPGDGSIELDLVDGDEGTYSHSSSASKGNFDVCVFDDGASIKQVKVWPRQAWWDRSNNMTLNVWKKKLDGSTISGNEMSFSGKMFTYNIEKEDTGYWGSWDGLHEVITIPDNLTILEPETCNTSDYLEIPFIGGEFYIILEVVDDQTSDGIVDIELTMSTCNVTQCPVNTYLDGTRDDDGSLICTRCPEDYYCDVGSTSIDDCSACPLHRELLSDDQSWCDIEECQTVVVTHDNGLGNPMDGIYHLFGTTNRSKAVYVSESLRYAISYNHNNDFVQYYNNDSFSVVDLVTDDIVAFSDSISNDDRYPFLLSSAEWHEPNVTHYDDIPYTKVQSIVITQRRNESSDMTMSMSEVEVYPKWNTSLNIGPTHMRCFNFPINTAWYWYGGNDYGEVNNINDGDLSTCEENGDPTGSQWWFCANEPCQYMCYLNDSYEIDHIVVYPRQDSWQWWRSTDVKIEVYESVEFAVELEQTNKSYDLMDAATFGPLIYEVDHIALYSEPNIEIPLLPTDEDAPIQVLCPYKYAFSCESTVDAQFCQNNDGYESWKALYAEYDSVDNSAVEWLCFNDSHLTDDLLNYQMKYSQSEDAYDIYFNIDDSSVEAVLDTCFEAYIVDEVDYNCSINGVWTDDMSALSAGDDIYCELTMKNENGDEILFDNLQWSTSIMAKEADFKYFPLRSVTTIGGENGTVSTYMTIPNCKGNWTVSLSVDQTPIGGDSFVLWSVEALVLSVDSSKERTGCDGFYGSVLEALIDEDSFESKFTTFTSFSEDMFNLSYVMTTTTTTSPTPNPITTTTATPTLDPIVSIANTTMTPETTLSTTTTTTPNSTMSTANTTSSEGSETTSSTTTANTTSVLVIDILNATSSTETNVDYADGAYLCATVWGLVVSAGLIFTL